MSFFADKVFPLFRVKPELRELVRRCPPDSAICICINDEDDLSVKITKTPSAIDAPPREGTDFVLFYVHNPDHAHKHLNYELAHKYEDLMMDWTRHVPPQFGPPTVDTAYEYMCYQALITGDVELMADAPLEPGPPPRLPSKCKCGDPAVTYINFQGEPRIMCGSFCHYTRKMNIRLALAAEEEPDSYFIRDLREP